MVAEMALIADTSCPARSCALPAAAMAPTLVPFTVRPPAAIAVAGECLRLWAAGHLEKSKEVTRSGPYRYTRHPLYLGSSTIGVGIAVASHHWIVAAMVVTYMALTLTAAMRSEEAHLREKFGDAYDAYAEKRAAPMDRPFSWARAIGNREHHTMAGLAAGLGMLAMKMLGS